MSPDQQLGTPTQELTSRLLQVSGGYNILYNLAIPCKRYDNEVFSSGLFSEWASEMLSD
jgi:hypothetical protein